MQYLTTEDVQGQVQYDLWLRSRLTTEAYRGRPMERAITSVATSLPGAPTRSTMSFALLGEDPSLMMVDLNIYRPEVNVEMLIDMGVRLFGLRVVCPSKWVYEDFAYKVDATFPMYYERIRKYNPNVWILGYGVHNPWSNSANGYNGPDPQVALLKEATRNHICDLYCWDDEVGNCWQGGKEITITDVNLLASISACMSQTLREFERSSNGLPKIPVHYSANWYMKKFAALRYQTWLDIAGREPTNRPFLTWRAWLPTVFNEFFATPQAMYDKVITPTGTQENLYLRMGSEPAADLWQCTFSLKGPWSPKIGHDASISYGLSKTISAFEKNANLGDAPTPPTPPSGDYVTREEFMRHTHTTGTPIV